MQLPTERKSEQTAEISSKVLPRPICLALPAPSTQHTETEKANPKPPLEWSVNAAARREFY